MNLLIKWSLHMGFFTLHWPCEDVWYELCSCSHGLHPYALAFYLVAFACNLVVYLYPYGLYFMIYFSFSWLAMVLFLVKTSTNWTFRHCKWWYTSQALIERSACKVALFFCFCLWVSVPVFVENRWSSECKMRVAMWFGKNTYAALWGLVQGFA